MQFELKYIYISSQIFLSVYDHYLHFCQKDCKPFYAITLYTGIFGKNAQDIYQQNALNLYGHRLIVPSDNTYMLSKRGTRLMRTIVHFLQGGLV